MNDPARRHQQIQAELAQIGIALPGSLTSRTTRCQRAACHTLGCPRNRGDFLIAVSCNFRRLLLPEHPFFPGSSAGFSLTRGLLLLPVSHGVPRSG